MGKGKLESGAFGSSRRLPTRKEIMKRAKERHMRESAKAGLPTITPTEAEVKESGDYLEARRELMRSEETEWRGQQRQYLDTMADEMGLEVVTKKEAKKIGKAESLEQEIKRMKAKAKKEPPKPKKKVARPPKPKLSTAQKWFVKHHQIPYLKKRLKKAHPQSAERVAVLNQIAKLEEGGWDEVTEGAYLSWKKQREIQKAKPKPKPKPKKLEKIKAKQERKPRAIVRYGKKHVLILCPQGHLIESHKLDRTYGGSPLESELSSRHYGDRFDRLAWSCKGAGHEPKKVTHVTPKPKPKKTPKPKVKPKPKRKRRKRRVARAGRTTRRFGDGEIISLPDEVWKVKTGKR